MTRDISSKMHIFLLVLLCFIAQRCQSFSSVPLLEHLSAQNLSILCLGDSLTEGMVLFQPPGKKGHAEVLWRPYSNRLQALLPRIKVVNAGVSGERTDQILHRVPSELERGGSKIGLVIVLGGTNDMVPDSITTADVISHLELIHQSVWAKGASTVSITMPALSWIRNLPNSIAKYKAVNQHLRELRRTKPSQMVGLLDLEERFVPQESEENRFFWGIDNAHLSDKGYERVAELLFKELERSAIMLQ